MVAALIILFFKNVFKSTLKLTGQLVVHKAEDQVHMIS